MNIKRALIFVVIICIIQQISAFNFCNCKEKGIDVCSCKKGITAPRPYPIQLPRLQKPLLKSICKESTSNPEPFKPIGDACHCGQQIVKPAPLPKASSSCLPKLNFNLPKPCSCNCNNNEQSRPDDCGSAIRAPEQYQTFASDGATIYMDTSRKSAQAPKPTYAPADIVSIQIAKRLAASAKNSVSERQLQYGSLKDPIVEERKSKKQNNINEESFYDTKGHVLAIQPRIFKQQKDISSEEESEEQKPKKINTVFDPAHLEFDEIGYQAYEPSKPRYVVVKNSDPVKHDCNKRTNTRRHFHKKGESCDCFKDLVVDQSAVSEQSTSFESNDHHFSARFST